MPNWTGGIITARGRELQAKVEAGETLVITKMKLGSGTPQAYEMDTLTDLKQPLMEFGISSKTVENNICEVTGVVVSSEIETPFYAREWGLFAQDPDEGEILYMYTTDPNPDFIPAKTAALQISATYALNIVVLNVDNIIVNIDPNGLVTTAILKNELKKYLPLSGGDMTGDITANNVYASNNVLVFNNVEEMKASNKVKTGYTLKTLGFYTAGDGGEADYLITDNIGEDEADEASIIALQKGLYAKLLTNNYINIKQWGAYGNAANDDTAIFEKAINYINKNKKMLYLPIGRYKITKELPSIYSGANIIGEIMGYDITDTTGTVICDNRKSNEPLFRFVSNNQQMGGCIKNIDFQSQNHADTTYETSGLSLEGSGYDYILENLRFVNYEGTIIKSSCIGAKLKDITVISCGSSIKRDTPKYAIDIAGSMHMCNQIHMEHCRYAYKISGIAHRFINCYLEMSGRGITEETSSPIVIDTSGTSSTCSFVGCEYINIPYVAYSKETPVYLFKVNGNSNNSINVTNVTINSCIVNNGRGSGVYEIPSSVPNSGICFLKTENGKVNVLIEGCSLNNLTTNTHAISSSSIVSFKNTEFRYVCLELTGDYSSINRETKLGVYTGDGSCIGCSFYMVLNTYTINQIDFLILTSLNSNSIFSNYRRYTDGTKGELVAAGGITYGQAYK